METRKECEIVGGGTLEVVRVGGEVDVGGGVVRTLTVYILRYLSVIYHYSTKIDI